MATRTRTPAHRLSLVRSSIAPIPASSTAAATDQLPAYRKPIHPLTPRAQDQIKALNDRSIGQIKEHAQRSEKCIIDVACLINDKLHEHEENMAKRQKQWDKGVDTETRANEEAWSMKFRGNVEDRTEDLEKAMRGIIDTTVAAERIEATLKWLHQNAPGRIEQEYQTQMTQRGSLSQSQNRRDTQGSEAISEGPTPGPTPLDGSRPVLTGVGEIFQDRLTRKEDEYTSMSLGSRYAHHNAYVNFKRLVHDAKYGDERPQPRPDTWFTEVGSPAPGVTQRGDDDDEDDIVFDRTNISTRCPLTFQKFKEPFTSSKCPHTFEKTAILDMIRHSTVRVGGGSRAVECPVAGCSQMLTADDLYHDAILIRKLARMQRAEQQASEESGDDDDENRDGSDDEVELSHTQSPQQRRRPQAARVKTEPPPSSNVEDLGSPSDDEDEDEELV